MNGKKKLMIDMDDVICTNGFLCMINKFLGSSYTNDDFKEFYMQDILPDKDKFFDWFMTQNMYDYCELMPDCYDVLKELNQEYDLFIATDYVWREISDKSGYIVEHKFNWLKKNLPFIKPQQYIFLANKSVLNMDIRIDDKISNLDGADMKLLFTAYHNKGYSDEYLGSMGIERMNSWIDIKNRLL